MKLVTYQADSGPELGAVVEGGVVSLTGAGIQELATMTSLIESGREGLALAAQVLETAGDPIFEYRLLAPFTPASLRDFVAFEDHAKAGAARRGEELNPTWYERPIYYKGNPRSIWGPDEDLPIPGFTQELDFELEVACIAGARIMDAGVDEARDAIFGYTVMNDWSARDVQRQEMAVRLGPSKSKDFATSLGPCIVTADEFPEPISARMSATVNGDIICEANLADARWTFPEIISYVSTGEEIWPGDLFGSGTPFGGCMLDRGGPYLKEGDVIELTVERIGSLRTRVTAPNNSPK